MLEIAERLFLGDEGDCLDIPQGTPEWSVIHACKDPCHRHLLGYRGRGLDPSHPQYLWAQRENHLYLNMVDASNPKYFSHEMIQHALEFIALHHDHNRSILIHCVKGISRSPSLMLLYLSTYSFPQQENFEEALHWFSDLYPAYDPQLGIYEHMASFWDTYLQDGRTWREHQRNLLYG